MVDFDTRRTVMLKPFSIAVHKNTLINYLEIIAVSSHQVKEKFYEKDTYIIQESI